MEPITNSIFAKASIFSTTLGTALLTLSNAHALEILKNDTNATGLLDVNSWVGGAVPGTSDVAVWDSTVATADQSALPNVSSTVFAGIRIANPVSNVGFGVSSGKALSLGTSGIDMSAATVNLAIGGAGILRPTASSTSSYSVASGRTLTIDAQFQASSGTTTEAINFGAAASVADSRGEVEFGSGATLYLGSEGVDIVSTNAYTANFKANGGTIGAKATWTSTVPVALAASSTLKAADAADAAFDITLNAGVSGAGGLTKTGGGTLTLGVVAPNYGGDTTVSSDTLSLAQPNGNNEASTASIASGAFLNLNFVGTDTVEKLFIDGVQQLEGTYEAVGNPGSGIETSRITGSYTLPGGPAKEFFRLKVVQN